MCVVHFSILQKLVLSVQKSFSNFIFCFKMCAEHVNILQKSVLSVQKSFSNFRFCFKMCAEHVNILQKSVLSVQKSFPNFRFFLQNVRSTCQHVREVSVECSEIIFKLAILVQNVR